ncbi:ROK family protein, partial [Streptomyces sp. HSW2009]|uniref:ROK family protein n=1 Tax=Streptomyces sp. HSW2009 TaxID=3142890 RepID=UPI0032EEA2E7
PPFLSPPPPAPPRALAGGGGGCGVYETGVARASYERAAQALAAGIAATASLIEVERVVIGGGVAGAGEVLFAPLRRTLRDYARLSFVRDLTVVPARTGTDAGLIGAAAAAARAGGLAGFGAVQGPRAGQRVGR